MRALLLLLSFLAACGSPAPEDSAPMRRPSGVLQPPDDGTGVAKTSDDGGEVEVLLTVPEPPEAVAGTVSFVGAKPDRLSDGWMVGGTKPDFFWSSPVVALGPTVSLRAPLEPGLHYMAVINPGDGDDLPSPGDLVSEPVEWAGGPRFEAVVDQHFGQSRRTQGEAGAAEGRAARLELDLAVDGAPPTGKLRVVVLGRTEQRTPGGGPPAFFWRSEPERVRWPWTVEAQVPEGLTVEVVVDADKDGMPSEGDPLSAPMPALKIPATGPLKVRLDRRFHGP